jgi:hypothetical protein
MSSELLKSEFGYNGWAGRVPGPSDRVRQRHLLPAIERTERASDLAFKAAGLIGSVERHSPGYTVLGFHDVRPTIHLTDTIQPIPYDDVICVYLPVATVSGQPVDSSQLHPLLWVPLVLLDHGSSPLVSSVALEVLLVGHR